MCHPEHYRLLQMIIILHAHWEGGTLVPVTKQQSFACDLARRLNPTSPTDGVGDAKLLKSLECSIKGLHLYGALEVKD
jgi:hypothetical protein